MSCSKTRHLVLAGIELPLSGLIQQTTKKFKKIVICFITKKTGFDISCNGDNLHEMHTLFSWKNDKNISKCLLKTLPRMLIVMVCRNKSRMGLCTVKPRDHFLARFRDILAFFLQEIASKFQE